VPTTEVATLAHLGFLRSEVTASWADFLTFGRGSSDTAVTFLKIDWVIGKAHVEASWAARAMDRQSRALRGTKKKKK